MIETIVLDMGGVLMNHDIPACVKKYQELLGANFPQLGLCSDGEPAPNIKSILYDYEIGGASSEDFVNALLPLCKEGTSAREILDAWNLMLAGIPAHRLEKVLELRKRYPMFLLSNNNEEHWRYIVEQYFTPETAPNSSPETAPNSSPETGHESPVDFYGCGSMRGLPEVRRSGLPVAAYFDETFLSHLMRIGKPDIRIYEEADKVIAERWKTLPTAANHPYDKSTTIFVDDLPANRESAMQYGWQTCASLEELNVLLFLQEHHIPFTWYNHPEGKTIEEAKRWWHDDGSVHCKNLFFRNHKGNVHYLVCFDCDHDLAIHDLEHRLKASLVAAGKPAPGKLSFASPERMMRYLGLQPGSVSPFGLINDKEHEVILFLDKNLLDAPSLSFHPNDCRGTVVISRDAFQDYLRSVGNTVEYLELY